MHIFLVLSAAIAFVSAAGSDDATTEAVVTKPTNFNAKEMLFGTMPEEEKQNLAFKEEQKVWYAKVLEKLITKPETESRDLNDLIYQDLNPESRKAIGFSKEQELWFGRALERIAKSEQTKGLFRVPEINPDKTGPPSDHSQNDHSQHENSQHEHGHHDANSNANSNVKTTLKGTSSQEVIMSTTKQVVKPSPTQKLEPERSSGSAQISPTGRTTRTSGEKSSGSQNEWAIFGGAVAAAFVVLL